MPAAGRAAGLGRQAGNRALPPALIPKQTGAPEGTTPDDAG